MIWHNCNDLATIRFPLKSSTRLIFSEQRASEAGQGQVEAIASSNESLSSVSNCKIDWKIRAGNRMTPKWTWNIFGWANSKLLPIPDIERQSDHALMFKVMIHHLLTWYTHRKNLCIPGPEFCWQSVEILSVARHKELDSIVANNYYCKCSCGAREEEKEKKC